MLLSGQALSRSQFWLLNLNIEVANVGTTRTIMLANFNECRPMYRRRGEIRYSRVHIVSCQGNRRTLKRKVKSEKEASERERAPVRGWASKSFMRVGQRKITRPPSLLPSPAWKFHDFVQWKLTSAASYNFCQQIAHFGAEKYRPYIQKDLIRVSVDLTSGMHCIVCTKILQFQNYNRTMMTNGSFYNGECEDVERFSLF